MARTVLVVDDEALVRDVIAAMLEDLGCRVAQAADAREALAVLAADQRITILITDVNMPGMSGYGLAREASRSRPDLRVIVLSGRETDGRGFPLIRKPFAQDDLWRAMRNSTGTC